MQLVNNNVSADYANKKYGENYGVDWVYLKTPQQIIDAEFESALPDEEIKSIYLRAMEKYAAQFQSIAADVPEQSAEDIWKSALIFANNICVQISDEYNNDDHINEASVANQCATKIKGQIEYGLPPELKSNKEYRLSAPARPDESLYIIFHNDKVNSILAACMKELNQEQLSVLRDCLIERTPLQEGRNIQEQDAVTFILDIQDAMLAYMAKYKLSALYKKDLTDAAKYAFNSIENKIKGYQQAPAPGDLEAKREGWVEKIIELSQPGIPYYSYGDNEAACKMAILLNEIAEIARAHTN